MTDFVSLLTLILTALGVAIAALAFALNERRERKKSIREKAKLAEKQRKEDQEFYQEVARLSLEELRDKIEHDGEFVARLNSITLWWYRCGLCGRVSTKPEMDKAGP